jgi:enoyl-CoA hydratase
MSVEVSRNGEVAVITINRPDALNALDVETVTALRDRLQELATDAAARVVVLTGAGEKAFIAGADIKYMTTLSLLEGRAWGALGHECATLLEQMPKPTVAAVNGFALGGGCEMALACDIRYASSRARFGQPEVNLGILPGWGGTQRLARTVGIGIAKELILTGRLVGADEALRIGLVNAVFPPEELLDKALELAHELAAKSPSALAFAKQATNLSLQGAFADGLAQEATLFAATFGTEDRVEGMAAFIEKRPPSFTGK